MRYNLQRKARNNLILLALTFGLIIGLLGLLAPAYADEVPEYQQLETEVVPIERVFQQVQKEFDGIILELELEDEESQWIYEVKLLTPQGNVLKIEYDAKTMALIDVKGRRDHSP